MNNNTNKPTIKELERILADDDVEIEIRPDGSIIGVAKGTARNAEPPKPITSKYAAAEFY